MSIVTETRISLQKGGILYSHMDSPEHIYAVQHVRKMRGGAQAHLLRASDNRFYVTKFQNNPQGARILANDTWPPISDSS